MRTSVERLLNAYGLMTESYPSAEAFLSDAKTAGFGCIVLDIHLAGISGIELRRRLKGAQPKLPVIFITAVDDDALELEARRIGCVAYLHKPFPAASLIDAINEAFAGSATD
ncbi:MULTISPECIES: response regulator transcription factor [Rhizobium]|nr:MULTISPECIES: response regulator [Rhizobium]MCV9943862.1 response regulator [Rhizobium sp. BT-175]MCW0017427.1 response regulator [Rhizobium sp. BT-226]